MFLKLDGRYLRSAQVLSPDDAINIWAPVSVRRLDKIDDNRTYPPSIVAVNISSLNELQPAHRLGMYHV